MRISLTRGAMLVALALAALPAHAQAPTPAPATPAERAVAALYREGIDAFNARDLDAFMTQFADDVEMYTHAGWLRGREAVHRRFAGIFERFPAIRMEVHELRVREVAPGTVVVDFQASTRPAGSGPAYHTIGSGVYVRREGRWVEVLEHETTPRVDAELRTAGG